MIIYRGGRGDSLQHTARAASPQCQTKLRFDGNLLSHSSILKWGNNLILSSIKTFPVLIISNTSCRVDRDFPVSTSQMADASSARQTILPRGVDIMLQSQLNSKGLSVREGFNQTKMDFSFSLFQDFLKSQFESYSMKSCNSIFCWNPHSVNTPLHLVTGK